MAGYLVGSQRYVCRSLRLVGLWNKECADLLHRMDALGVGEDPKVPDAVKTARPDMQEKAADELIGRQAHGFIALGFFCTIVFPLECHGLRITGNQATIGDRNPVGIP